MCVPLHALALARGMVKSDNRLKTRIGEVAVSRKTLLVPGDTMIHFLLATIPDWHVRVDVTEQDIFNIVKYVGSVSSRLHEGCYTTVPRRIGLYAFKASGRI